MKYRHQFRVPASVERVAEFHAHSASMATNTPSPIVVKVQHAPPVLADGDEMHFTMWLGLPVLFSFRA
jgi:ligand-binding SRPBCC domain-containing protein